jgi:ribosomal protein S18 acetylase RimI-like enzyme
MIADTWRAGRCEDAPAITALTHAVYAKWVAVIGRLPLPMQVDYVEAISQHAFTLVERGTELIGLIETEDRADHLYIVNVAVAQTAQGQGLGRRLVGHAENQARARGFGEVRLMTNERYESNIRLYEFLGYEIYQREPFLNGVRVMMRKDVAAGGLPPLRKGSAS